MRNLFTKLIAVSLLGGMLAACASIVDGGTTKPVSVNSAITGQKFKIRDKSGKIVYSGTTPTTVNLQRSGSGWFEGQQYTIQLEDGTASAVVNSSATGWYIAGNFFIGGLVGWLIVDPLTGAMHTLRPDSVNLR